ncbi:MAG TPA: prolyl oligopeptidase family serine peptidase [Vicinamibacterales bacterium]|nr:prolyl oligopeptidase family serine peptidase [Vicinamibacterales bacterium]
MTRAVPLVCLILAMQVAVKYPETRKEPLVEDHFGVTIADPYRWLEDDNSAETKAWVEAQNTVTFAYLESLPYRDRILKRLDALWKYERYGLPTREGPWYVFSRIAGDEKQPIVYRAKDVNAPPVRENVLIDPHAFDAAGTTAVTGMGFTRDGRYVAYGLSAGGSDWIEWRVRDVATAKDLPDIVKWSKFSGASWAPDGSGFYYSRYAEPEAGAALSAVNQNQKLYFHRLGTPQSADALIYERPDEPDWIFNADVTEDGRWLLLYQFEGTEPKNRIFVRDLSMPDAAFKPLVDAFDAEYTVAGNDGDTFFVRTNNGAPRSRLVAIDLESTTPASWTTLIPEPEGRDVLANVNMVGDRFMAVIRTHAQEQARVYRRDGTLERDVPLPGIGSIGVFSGKRADAESYFAFTSFTYPTTIFRYDLKSGGVSVFKRPETAFDPAGYETKQVFYTSKDGTAVPMFLTYRKGIVLDGSHPTYLYGYGGFDISITPGYSAGIAGWLEMGGIYAVANIRGGGEYGRTWHDGGRLTSKQNVFDDFIAAAEYLIREKYTSTPKLAIGGGSNGGLLVGAVITQRPDLVAAALPAVGVLDMLRFHKFTIGAAWMSDYGDPGRKEDFDVLITYSPLHNIKPGTHYPATMITTGDHDDRVVPAHSFKFAAALQAAQGGPKPILIRIETRGGHGAGKGMDKVIEERADQWSFLADQLKVKF